MRKSNSSKNENGAVTDLMLHQGANDIKGVRQ